jgi:hypothetical protein
MQGGNDGCVYVHAGIIEFLCHGEEKSPRRKEKGIYGAAERRAEEESQKIAGGWEYNCTDSTHSLYK